MCLRGGVGFGPQVLLHYSCRGLGTGHWNTCSLYAHIYAVLIVIP